jgi:acyl-CoA synthetase (AMP-forming)/AMP-acid ligase II
MFATIAQIVRHWGRCKESATAVISPFRDWTYADLDQESNRIAQGLLSLGIRAGDRVGCLTRNSPECLSLLFGAAKVGAVCVPMNWRLAPVELEYVIEHSESRLLVVDSEFRPIVERLDSPRVETVLTAEPDQEGSLTGWASAYAAVDPEFPACSDDTVLQLYSSGTTGKPKGVEITHAGLLYQCSAIGDCFGFGSDGSAVLLDVLPNFHVSGIVVFLSVLHAGAVVVTRPEFAPEEILDAMERHGVSHAVMVPTMIRMLVQAMATKRTSLPGLRVLAYGGSPVSDALLKEVQAVLSSALVQIYGMTELSGLATCLGPDDHARPELLRSAGRPLPKVELNIRGAGGGSVCEEGAAGEIWVRSPSVMKGYFRNPEATSETIPKEEGGWLRSGDVGYLKNGYLFIIDRVKELIISGGENIYPTEVENVLSAHPDVADVAVIGVPDAKWGEAVKACVVLKEGAQADAAALLAFARGRLAHYKCPKSIDFLPALPRNPSGKLLKRELRGPYWQGQDRAIG